MKKRFTEEQIIKVLEEGTAGKHRKSNKKTILGIKKIFDSAHIKKPCLRLLLNRVNEKLAATYSSYLLWQVPLATKGLTSEFGMGSGVALSL